MRYYIIAGEASGDLHGGNLLQALRKEDPAFEAKGWGGDNMQHAGMHLAKHYRELAFMGFVEVVKNLPTIIRNLTTVKQDILSYRPDVLILIDYPGFNLRIARWAHQHGIRVFYYVSPQLWAWHQSRVKQVKAYVDHMFVVLPFEVDFYQSHGVKVDYAGHPLLDALSTISLSPDFYQKHRLSSSKPIIALLPGSRHQEITRMLPVMADTAVAFPDYQFVVAAAPAQSMDLYQSLLKNKPLAIVANDTYQLLMHSAAALVTSGTATLETSLLRIPQVVCYKGGSLSYAIGKRLVKVNYISLVNLIMGREVVKELIQHNCTTEHCRVELERIMQSHHRQKMLHEYDELAEKLGQGGASDRVARLMINYMK